jgi:hypothetical protein
MYKPANTVAIRPTGTDGGRSGNANHIIAPNGSKSEKTFYTNTKQSGTIIPKLGSIAEYNTAIEDG